MSVLVTKEAPDFTAAAVLPDGTIRDVFKLSEIKGEDGMKPTADGVAGYLSSHSEKL
jgi:hypothetical protein